jgi:hypothetical protein
MARLGSILSRAEAIPTLEVYKEIYHSTTSVGTSATALPATNLSYRKAILVQNLHASNIVYLGGNRPDIIKSSGASYLKETGMYWRRSDIKSLNWLKSAGGTNEYYAVLASTGGDPGLTEPLRMYGITSAGGSETLLTNGTVGSLANLNWDWGDGDTLGYNTIYFRHNSGNPVDLSYLLLLSYTLMPDTSSTYGHRLGPYDAVALDIDGSVRLFAIASGASTPVSCVEFA